jgi:septum formation protein
MAAKSGKPAPGSKVEAKNPVREQARCGGQIDLDGRRWCDGDGEPAALGACRRLPLVAMVWLGDEASEQVGTHTLVLASSSPRRRDLLASVGLAAEILTAAVDETPLPGEKPVALVARLALAKARAGAEAHAGSAAGDTSSLVIGADTVIDLDGVALGKPADDAEAVAMLQALRGRSHHVRTGIAVVAVGAEPGGPRERWGVASTEVTMRPYTPDEIDWYVSTGEPQGKAGSYAIQGRGGLLVSGLTGSYDTVVGLSLPLLDRLLQAFGAPIRRLVDA